MDASTYKFPKLKGSANYKIWKLRIEAILLEKGYGDLLYIDESTVTAEFQNELAQSSKKAAALVRLTLEDGPLIQTEGIVGLNQLLGALKTLYDPQGFSSDFLIIRDLFTTTLSKEKSIEGYLTRIKRLTDDLASRGLAIPNKVIAGYTLSNLSAEYNNTVAIISQSYRLQNQEIDLNQLFSHLIDESRRLQAARPLPEEETALNTRNSTNHTSKKLVHCSYCKKKGHLESKCWKKHPELQPKKGTNYPKQASSTRDSDQSELGLNTSETALLTDQSDAKNYWILDSGATSHSSASRDLFTEIRPCDITLNWGKAQEIRVREIGTVSLNLEGKTPIRLENCLYCPELGVNLLSTNRITARGLQINLKDSQAELILKGKVIAIGSYIDRLIAFRAYRRNEQAYISNSANHSNIWHHRLGHIGRNALRELPNTVIGAEALTNQDLTQFTEQTCDTCVQAKQTSIISREPTSPASNYLEKVYSDVCGPIQPITSGKNRYFLSIIDDFTRWAFVQPIKTKDTIISAVPNWLIQEERQSELKVKRFHSDNALEYKALGKELAKMGIVSTYTAPYTPAQNGHAERFNLTIMNKVRSMLITASLPKIYWAEALVAAVFLYNRTPHSYLGYKTPYEAKNKAKPDISNIRVWGSLSYKREPITKKLDPRAGIYILIGYGSNQFRLLDPTNRKIYNSRDVTIIEGKFISDINLLYPQINGQLATNRLIEDLQASDLLIGPDDELDTEDITPKPTSASISVEIPKYKGNLDDFEEYTNETAHITATTGTIEEPPSYKAILKDPNKDKWLEALNTEYKKLISQNTWTLVKLPQGRKPIKGKWVTKIKYPTNGDPIYKGRWVAKGFLQQPGIDFTETYANTVNPISYKLLLAIATAKDWEINQWDVVSAYPNAYLSEELYIEQPEGFEDGTNRVCKLNRALYGLKQSAYEWEQHLKKELAELGLIPLKADQSVYINQQGPTLILIAYVDDIIAISPSSDQIRQVYISLSTKLQIKDLGPISNFLGIEIKRNRANKAISLS
jgi:hypothetical protein